MDPVVPSLTDSVHVGPVCQIRPLIVDRLVTFGASPHPVPARRDHPFLSDPTDRVDRDPTVHRPIVDHRDRPTSFWDRLDPTGLDRTGQALVLPTDPWDRTGPCMVHPTF